MLKSTAYSFLMLSSFALHAMEQENKQSLSSRLSSKVQPIQLASLLQLKLNEITLLKAGQEVEITHNDNETLSKWIIMSSSTKNLVYRFFGIPSNEKFSIKSGIYILRNDAQLNDYIWHVSKPFGKGAIRAISKTATAHHLELYQVKTIEKPSIFKPSYELDATGYNLDIIYLYPDRPTEATEYFELNENNAPMSLDNPGFETHVKRIKDYVITNSKSVSIENLLTLERH